MQRYVIGTHPDIDKEPEVKLWGPIWEFIRPDTGKHEYLDIYYPESHQIEGYERAVMLARYYSNLHNKEYRVFILGDGVSRPQAILKPIKESTDGI